MRAGAEVYIDQCAACHTLSGAGIARMFPALKDSPSVLSDRPDSLLRVVISGTRAVSTRTAPTAPAMPAFGWKLSDEQIASVLTYVRNAWGNAGAAVSTSDVTSARSDLAKRRD